MTNDRIAALQKMALRAPADPRAHFGLALEYEKAGLWAETAAALRRYLELAEDEGNAWGRLGSALRHLGQDDDARSAYRRGIDAALRHGHPSMAAEFEEILDDWD
jgi:Flp pilus assembly protein TadD